MKTLLQNSKFTTAFFTLLGLFFVNIGNAQTNTWDGSSSANWNTAANWSLNLVPTSAHDVVIPNGITVTITVNTAAVCNTFTMNGGNTANTVTISASNSLTVSNGITIGAGTGNGDNKILAVNAGTLSCASIDIAAPGNTNRTSSVTLSTGTINVSGDITLGSTDADFTFTGAGTLNVGGNMSGGTFTASTGTVDYNGSGAQSIGVYTYNNLTTSTSGAKTLSTGTTVNGTVRIQGTSTLVYGAANLVNNASAVQLNGGTFNTGSTTGFTDQVGVLTLLENSNIALGTGNHTLTFANSSGASWTAGKKIIITGWVGGYNGTAASGTNPKIFVGTAASNLSTAQKNQIQFYSGTNNYAATLLSTGELVPTATLINGIGSFSPTTVCAGSTLSITGVGFTGVTAVRVNGVNVASYTVNSSTSITAVLSTSNTTGFVSVVTSGLGTYTSYNSLTVNPIPTSVTATPSATVICTGGSINLTSSATSNSGPGPVTLLNENFNSTPVGWTTANTSTGGTPANAAWTLRANGYANANETFNSNDASQFYLTDSDAQGSGSTTATILQSPAFSTIGLSTASLSFYHYYRYNSGTDDRGFVEVSTDGTNWTTLTTYSSTQGTRNGFLQVTASLDSYLGQATVYTRFRYTASFDWYWAIDNVLVSGTYTSVPATYAWTAAPSGYTSAVQNPTGVSPTVNTAYTVTVTNGYGCTASATTSTVTVNALPVAGTLTPNVAAGAVCTGQSVSATLAAGSGGAGTIVDELERSLSGGAYAAYTSGTSISTTGQTSVSIRTRRTATGSGCTTSGYNTVTWTVNALPVAGTLTPNVAAGAVCIGQSVSATLTAGSGGAGTIVDELERSLSGGAYAAYTSGTAISTTGETSVSIRTRRTATGSGCTTSGYNTVTWTVNALPVAGTLTPNVAAGAVCTGQSVSATLAAGSGGAGTIVDELERSLSGGAYAAYTSGTAISTTGETSVSIRTRRTATGSGCTTSGYNTVTWTVNALPVAGTLTPNVAEGTVCIGQSVSATLAAGSGGAGTIVDELERSLSGGAYAAYTSGTSISTTGETSVSIRTRRTATGSGCTTSGYNTVTWTVSTANTWTGGASSTSWTATGNWSCGSVPTSATDVTISTASFYPIITSDVTINSLTIDASTTLKVNSTYDLTVTDVITNNGTLTIENSGNLLQVNNVANTGSGSTIVKRNTNLLIRLDYTLWSSPVSGQNLFSFSPLTSVSPNIRFYTYNSTINFPATTGFYQSVAAYATTDFALGKGYLIRLPFNHPTTQAIWNGQFSGVPNNGTPSPSVAITDSGDRFNAVGNPYPSPISIAQFATDNSANIETSLYFWRKTNNSSSPSYCSWNTATSTYGDNGEAYTESPLGVIQTGQGFFVQAKAGASTLIFNNGQRIGDNANQFFRTPVSTTTIEANRIWLNMRGTTSGFSQSVVGYFTNATLDADDTDSRYFNDGPIALTSTIANQDYVIQGRPLPFDANDVVPMKYKVTTAGNFTIAIDHVDGLFSSGQTVYLRDNLTAVVHNLTSGGYTFASDAGTFDSRFEIVYALPLGVDNPTFTANGVVIYTQNNEFVVNSGNITMSSVKVFDIRGRLLEEEKGINANQTTIGGGLANEVLLVQITSVDGITVTKKVIK